MSMQQGGDDRMHALFVVAETDGEPTTVDDNPSTVAAGEPPIP